MIDTCFRFGKAVDTEGLCECTSEVVDSGVGIVLYMVVCRFKQGEETCCCVCCSSVRRLGIVGCFMVKGGVIYKWIDCCLRELFLWVVVLFAFCGVFV